MPKEKAGQQPELKEKTEHRNYILVIAKADNVNVSMGSRRLMALAVRDSINTNGGQAKVILVQKPKEIGQPKLASSLKLLLASL